MPLFAVICRDHAGKLQTRLDTREKHLAFLKRKADVFQDGSFAVAFTDVFNI